MNGGLSILLPWPPSRNALWRAVKCGRGKMQLKSRAYKDWWAEAERAISCQDAFHVTGRVRVRIDLHPPSRRLYDPDNYSKAILDFLVEVPLIDGDSNRTIARLSTVPHDAGDEVCGVWAHIEPVEAG